MKEPAALMEIAREAAVQVVQLHGDESAQYCAGLAPWPVLKAIRTAPDAPLEDLGEFDVRGFLVDAKDDLRFGGTGRTCDWETAIAAKRFGPVILSGGLNPDNVAHAIAAVRPYGVDVCSGVETAPGVKDHNRIASFMAAAGRAGEVQRAERDRRRAIKRVRREVAHGRRDA